MLDVETKRRIDGARDVLVGKVPDPKSQVEQITIALIYKFMDDLDAESEELGGTRTFFAGEFARYGWAKLMRSGLGGHETLNLYAEAVTRMPENPGIPPLFRDMFKNAYLPYRDPETLRAFLKIINEFTYDHSERLGDAFEYLLSVLGSQGDAGQFRTPRHIIDFIVAVLDPKKDETILDPACGTAGFLISSYKHILRTNVDKDGNNALTPDDKGRLATNFKGYDISPDMVRLSLVNMYLHGFAAPHVFEYDTLTSEDRWNEYADVILANPPFMSPKGGIRPHNRFSVKSKRSEVLFVDYMAEHLTPNGRAGIIVPEGIIFQSQNAHKQLRKMLVEEYLIAVISLPAGVFNPYAGVKTSVLILDKSLAKSANHVAFFKVENDGFDLGAQRRPIDENDLSHVQAEIAEYMGRLRAGESVDTARVTEPGAQYTTERRLVVGRDRVAESGEYNLSGDRYREVEAHKYSKWPMVELGDVCQDILSGGTPSTKNEEYWKGNIPWITSADIVDLKTARPRKHITEEAIRESATNLIKKGNVIVVTRVGLGKLFRNDFDVCISQDSQGLIVKKEVSADYLVYILKDRVENFKKVSQGSTIQGVTKKQLSEIQIPLPPLKVQQKIIAEIEVYQKVVNGARAVIDSYCPHVPINSNWPMVTLGEVCHIFNGSTPSRKEAAYWDNGTIPWFTVDDIRQNGRVVHETIQRTTVKALEETSLRLLPTNSVLLCCTASVGEYAFAEIELTTNQQFNSLVVKEGFSERLLPKYLFHLSGQFKDELLRFSGKTSFNFVSVATLKKMKFSMPPLEVQEAIVAEIELEQSLVDANRQLIEQFEKKIRNAVERVWGREARQQGTIDYEKL